jgi:hypothetical protein
MSRSSFPFLRENEAMARRYWAVGGECLDLGFDPMLQDERRVLGPYDRFEEAEQAWRKRESELGQRYLIVTLPPIAWRSRKAA